MGKTLVIKGADFSENSVQKRIDLYYDGLTEIENKGIISDTSTIVSTGSAGYGVEGLESGQIVNYMRAKVFREGTVKLYSGDSYTDTNPVELLSVQFSSSEIGSIVEKNFDDVTLPAGKVFWLYKHNGPGDNAINYYTDEFEKGMRFKCGTDNPGNVNRTLAFSVDIGLSYYDMSE